MSHTGETRHEQSLVITVPEAGRMLGIGRNSAYEAARRGEIPVIRIGKLLRVPWHALERMLEDPTSANRVDPIREQDAKRAKGRR